MSSTRSLVRGLAAATCVGMLLVLVMGAAVTNTGSAEGCGRSWPLCNGQFVPEFTVATAIEYSHRAVTGVETVLILVLAAAMLVLWRRQSEVLILAGLMVGTLFLQAGLGAGAVVWPQSALMLATHFGVSLIAFASTFLSAAVVFERTRPSPRPHVALAGVRNIAIVVTLYVLGVVYLGAYVRHAGVSLACADWPLCNGQLLPVLGGPTGVVFAHRVAAIGAVVLLAILFARAREAPLAGGSALVLVVLQALSGALVVWTRLGLFSTLLHAVLMGLLFATLAYLVRLTLLHPERNDSVAYVRRLSDATARSVRENERTDGLHALGETGSGIPRTGELGAVAYDGRRERSVGGAAQPSAESR